MLRRYFFVFSLLLSAMLFAHPSICPAGAGAGGNYGYSRSDMDGGSNHPAYAKQKTRREIDDEVLGIKAAIKKKGARWSAKESHMTRLTVEERKARLGYMPPDTYQDYTAGSPPPSVLSFGTTALSFPATLDWRNFYGAKNYVTGVRNQGSCGSCWAFGSVAALEARSIIDANMPGTDLDLSEQAVIACANGDCSGGPLVTSFFVDTGSPLEACYPYAAANGDCANACADWQSSAYKISGYTNITPYDVQAMKDALNEYGPLVVSYMVYSDFNSYSSGIYSYTWGVLEGGHGVLLVGYDDVAGCFIVKNSWGPSWGEAGYFRIAYSEVASVTSFGQQVLAYGSQLPQLFAQVSNPMGGAMITDPVYTIRGSAQPYVNSAIDRVEVSTDGGSTWNTATDTSGNGSWSTWSYDWSTTVQGAAVLKSRAIDEFGTTGGSYYDVSVSVDSAPPVSSVTSPADGATITSTSTTITGTADDGAGSGVARVEVSTDGGATWHTAAGTASWSYEWASDAGGGFNIRSRATDNEGHVESPGPGVNVSTKWPVSAITAPADGEGLQGPSYVITGTAVDYTGTGLDKVEVSTDAGATWGLATGTAAWSYSWTPPASGVINIKSRATDNTAVVEVPALGINAHIDYAGPDGAGVPAWTRLKGGTGNDYGKDVAVDGLGNAYVAGYGWGTIDGQPSAGATDAVVAKYDANGNWLWTRTAGSSQDDETQALAVDASGNVYVAGYTRGTLPGRTSQGNNDYFVVKFDTDGNQLWTLQDGSSGHEFAFGICADSDGNFYVGGNTTGALHGETSAGGHELFVVKYAPDGTRLWTRMTGSPSTEYGFGLGCNPSGDVCIAGYTSGSVGGTANEGGYDIIAALYDKDGVLQWTRQTGTAVSDTAFGACVDAAGNAYVTGNTEGALDGCVPSGYKDAFLIKYDRAGDRHWTAQWGTTSTDEGRDVYVDAGGFVSVAGITGGDLDGNHNSGQFDVFLTQFHSTGMKLWTRVYGTPDSDHGYGVAAGPAGSGGLCVAGYTNGTLGGETGAGNFDMFVMGMDRQAMEVESGSPGTNSVDVTLTPAASDPAGVAFMQFSNYSTSGWGAWQNYTTSAAWTLTAGEGVKTVYGKFRDTLGNESAVFSDTILLETAAPSSSITAPASGALVGGPSGCTITGTATDASGSGVSLVEVSTDGGATWNAATGTGPWSFLWQPSADGPANVLSRATDYAGNAETPGAGITLNADVTPPVSFITDPADGASINAATYTVSGTASDGSGVTLVEVSTNGGSTWSAASGTASWSFEWTLPSDGTYNVRTRARDAVGNVETPGAGISVMVDSTLPTGSVTINSGDAFTGSTSVTLSLSATDPQGVASMQFSNYSTSGWGAWVNYTTSAAWTLEPGDGPKTVHARFKDTNGNPSPVYSDAITLDATAPAAAITDPADGAYIGGTTYAVTGTAGDGTGSGVALVEVSTDGGSSWSVAAGTTSWSYAWTLPSGGTRTLVARSTDAAGNTGAPGPGITVYVDKNSPSGSVTINTGASWTKNDKVLLGLDATDSYMLAEMRISDDGLFDTEPWEPYEAEKVWTFTPVHEMKTVDVIYRDAAGNESAAASDSIEYVPSETCRQYSMWTWGSNEHGELGAGTADPNPHPWPQELSDPMVYDFLEFAGGYAYLMGLRPAGDVWGWGNNEHGKLGNGMTGDEHVPNPTMFNNVMAVDCGPGHTVAAAVDGSVLSSGQNDYGQLGMGVSDFDDHAMPEMVYLDAVTPFADAVSVAAGFAHTLAARMDGSVWAWGYNEQGQLGQGTTDPDPHPYPAQVDGVDGITKVCAGMGHSVALRFDGTVWSWGYNADGQLGRADAPLAPGQVTGIPGTVVDITCGMMHTVAITDSGDVWTWGANDNGQLGRAGDPSVPGQVLELSGIMKVSSMPDHNLALGNDGSVWSWGANDRGQLGQGGFDTDPHQTPMPVPMIGGAISVGTGGMVSAVVQQDTYPPTVSVSSVTDGALLSGASIDITGTADDLGGFGVAQVEVSTDSGATWECAVGAGSWRYTWAPPGDGTYSIDVTAWDEACMQQGSTPISVTVDNTPPSCAITAPENGAELSGVSYTITGTASDANGVASVEVSTDGGSTWSAATGTSSWSYDWTLSSDGSYNIIARATDAAGNTGTPASGIDVVVDNSAPTAAITDPADSAVLTGSSYLVTGTADDGTGTGVAIVEVSTDGGNTWSAAAGTASWSYDWTLPSAGSYSIKTRATDAAGNTGTPGSGITVTVSPDPPYATIWNRQLGTDETDSAEAAAVDANGDVYVVGTTEDGMFGYANAGGVDYYIAKYSTDGSLLWYTQAGSASNDLANAVAVDGSALYVAGMTDGQLDGYPNSGGYDAFLVRYDTDGNRVWTVQYGTGAFDGIRGIAVDSAGDVYISGMTEGSMDGNASAGSGDMVVIKYDPAGNRQWVFQYGSAEFEGAPGVAVDGAGGVYAAGFTFGGLDGNVNAGGMDAFVVKLDGLGGHVWTKQAGTAGFDGAWGVDAGPTGDVFVCGETEGGMNGNASHGLGDIFLMKLDPDGIELWTRQAGTGSWDTANALDVDGAGNAYVAGSTAGSFGPEPNLGGDDVVLVKYDTDGNLLWSRQTGSADTDAALGVSADGLGKAYVCGYTWGSVGGYANAGVLDVFVTKFGVIPQHCNNSVADGGEAGVDCGGPDCVPCTDHCDNGVMDADETDVDCGGLDCVPCDGHCANGVMDADETGVDCGGAYCAPCPLEDPYDASWTRQTGTAASDMAHGVALDGSGNILVAGRTSGPLDGHYNKGSNDMFLIKYGPLGAKLWSVQKGSSSSDIAYAVAADASGNSYVVGSTSGLLGSNTWGWSDVFVMKFGPSGAHLWTKQVGTASGDYGYGVGTDAAGNVYVGGYTAGQFSGNTSQGQTDGFVMKLDSTGGTLWTRQFGTSSEDRLYGLAVDSAGNSYAAGWTRGSMHGEDYRGGWDYYVVKHDSSGTRLWTAQYGTGGTDTASAVSVDGDGNVFVAGYTDGDLDGRENEGGNDAFVVKYDSNGNRLWSVLAGSPAYDVAEGVSADPSGNVFVTGRTDGGMGGGVNAGSADVFVVKYDPSGAWMWTQQYGTPAYEMAFAVASDATGAAVAGYTNGDMDAYASAGEGDIFVLRLDDMPPHCDNGVQDADETAVDCGGADCLPCNAHCYNGYIDADEAAIDCGGADCAECTDLDPPVSAITTLVDGMVIPAGAGECPVAGSADDGAGLGVSVVEVSTDGGASWVAATDTSVDGTWATWSFLWSVPAAGEYNVMARATDNAGIAEIPGPGVWVSVADVSEAAYSQAWSKSVPAAYRIDTDVSGFVYTAGTTSSDVIVEKYNGTGVNQWSRTFGSTASDLGYSIAAGSSGDSYTVGKTAGDLDGNTYMGSNDAFVMKYDAAGTRQWTRTLATADIDEGSGAAFSEAGYVYAAGSTFGDLDGNTNAGAWDLFVAQYDTAGNKIWTVLDGVSGTDKAQGAAADTDGNVYVVGYTDGALFGHANRGSYDVFLAKYDVNGNLLWSTLMGSSAADWGNAVAVGPDGDAYVAAQAGGPIDGNPYVWGGDIYVAKFSPDGTKQWSRMMGSPGYYNDSPKSIAVDANGNCYVCGYTEGELDGNSSPAGLTDLFVIKYNTHGVKLWTYQYATNSVWDYGEGVAVDGAGNVYASRRTSSPSYYLLKLADTRSPAGSLSINSGAQYANSADVTLRFGSLDGDIAQVQVSGDGTFDTEPWEAYAGDKSWTLASGYGAKTVYARIKDVSGNISAAMSDDIILDEDAPASFVSSPADAQVLDALSFNVSGTATDGAGSGLGGVEVSADGGISWVPATDVSSGIPWTEWSAELTVPAAGAYGIASRSVDLAGNVETPGPGVGVDVQSLITLDHDMINITHDLTGPPATAVFNVTASAGDISFTATPDMPWLSVDAVSATTPRTLVVTIDPAGQQPGFLAGKVALVSAGAGNSPRDININVTFNPYGQPELPHYDWAEYLSGSDCGACHIAADMFASASHDLESPDFCATCHNAACFAHEDSPDVASGHSVMASITSAGCRTPTYGNVTSGEFSNQMYAKLKDGDKVVCTTCHNVMSKMEDYGLVWGMTSTYDYKTYYMQRGGWSNYGYLRPTVYRDTSLWNGPGYSKNRKGFVVDPSEYTYDETAGTITFAAAQNPLAYVYVSLEYHYLRVSNESNRMCSDCHAQATHMGANCQACHDAHNTSNMAGMRETVRTPDLADRTVVFSRYTGANSFADGGAPYDGICEVCHTATDYHRHDGSGLASHTSTGVDYAGDDCTACHTHASGFAR